MEWSSGADLGAFFRQWLHQPGWPAYHVSWRWDGDARQVECTVRQVQTASLFDMPVDIVFSAEGWSETHPFRVSERMQKFRFGLPSKPLSVEVDPGGWLLKSVSVVPE